MSQVGPIPMGVNATTRRPSRGKGRRSAWAAPDAAVGAMGVQVMGQRYGILRGVGRTFLASFPSLPPALRCGGLAPQKGATRQQDPTGHGDRQTQYLAAMP